MHHIVRSECSLRQASMGAPGLTATVRAAMINAALRAAVKHHAFHADPGSVEAAVGEALPIAARGFSH